MADIPFLNPTILKQLDLPIPSRETTPLLLEQLNLKNVYPSMKNYKDDDIDYTLLILENITSDEEIYEFVNEIMKEDIALNDRLDKILQKIFKTTNPQLRHSLGAIRGGKKEIDFTNIIKEGF